MGKPGNETLGMWEECGHMGIPKQCPWCRIIELIAECEKVQGVTRKFMRKVEEAERAAETAERERDEARAAAGRAHDMAMTAASDGVKAWEEVDALRAALAKVKEVQS